VGDGDYPAFNLGEANALFLIRVAKDSYIEKSNI